MTRVVFFGTPEEAVPTLEALASRYEVGLVVTQPDRPKGRSGRPQPPPVKQEAERLGLLVAQPVNGAEMAEAVNSQPFELGVVVGTYEPAGPVRHGQM